MTRPIINRKKKYKYNSLCPQDLIKWMRLKKSNIQLAAKFGIAEKTFYDWLKEHPEFKEAFDIGDPQRFDALMEEGDELFKLNDKGYKHWQKKMAYMYRNYDPQPSDKGNTNVTIGNINMLQYQDKNPQELIEIIKNKMQLLKIVPETKLISTDNTDE